MLYRNAVVALIALMVVLVAVVAALPHPDTIPTRARGGHVYKNSVMQLERDAAASPWQRNTTVNTLPQWISHTDHSLGTFQQRWWVDYSAYTPGGEHAMLYINGEGEAHGSPDGYMSIYGRSINAVMFGLEHRFYGESLPAPLTNRTMLSHLTVENALADLNYFRSWLETNVLKKEMQWFIVGGSYSGALSAWSKATYPSSYVASWSSSGVVNARFDYYAFDGHIVSVLPTVCEQAISSVFAQFSAAFDDPVQRAAMMGIFGTPAYFTKEDMAWMLADGSAMAVQYGHKNYLCDNIVPLSKTNPFEQYANIITYLWGAGFTSSCYYSTVCLSDATFSDQWGPAGYAWVYQCCSQLAYWQAGYPNSLRLDIITTDYYINQCRQAFGESTFPDTYAFNAKFGGATPNATNVIALQGSDDPWQTAGVQQSLGPNYPEVLAQCNQCGHCGDLMNPQPSDPASLVAQRAAIVDNMNQWLGVNQTQQSKQQQTRRTKFF